MYKDDYQDFVVYDDDDNDDDDDDVNDDVESHSSVGNVADLRTEDRWFDPRLGQYSFRVLMIVIATGFIPVSLSLIRQRLYGKAASGLENNIVRSTV